MTNLEKLDDIFVEVFQNNTVILGEDFNKENVEGWDSVRQLALTTAVEEAFDIFLDPEDIIGFVSYENIIEILKKYDVEL